MGIRRTDDQGNPTHELMSRWQSRDDRYANLRYRLTDYEVGVVRTYRRREALDLPEPYEALTYIASWDQPPKGRM